MRSGPNASFGTSGGVRGGGRGDTGIGVCDAGVDCALARDGEDEGPAREATLARLAAEKKPMKLERVAEFDASTLGGLLGPALAGPPGRRELNIRSGLRPATARLAVAGSEMTGAPGYIARSRGERGGV